MDNSEILEIAATLIGIDYVQWLKVKTAIDAAFDKKRKEYELQLTLQSEKELKEAIRSRFG